MCVEKRSRDRVRVIKETLAGGMRAHAPCTTFFLRRNSSAGLEKKKKMRVGKRYLDLIARDRYRDTFSLSKLRFGPGKLA